LKQVFLADLTHTADGNIARYFPLGAAYVASYAQTVLGDDLGFQLFKFPEPMAAAVVEERPVLLGFSNYSWNLELTYRFALWAKQRFPGIVIVFGGPNFPIDASEKIRFFTERPAVDFHVESDGEIGFVSLLRALLAKDFDAEGFRRSGERVANCTYLSGDQLVEGEIRRIDNLDALPSPYLTGVLDPFFDLPLVPMLQTTRGCPFGCTFCADGLPGKSRIYRFHPDTTRAELEYIARRAKGVHELYITDLNFGMYRQDLDTARLLVETKEKYGFPLSIEASGGKNQQARVLEVAGLLQGSWITTSAIQSSDPEVLRNVNRSNISLDAYRDFANGVNRKGSGSASSTEIILGLPGDTREKHFNSLRYAIESGTSVLYMYQAILLAGTDMASQASRDEFGLVTRFRVIPGGLGRYSLAGAEIRAVELEEIVVASRVMPFEDYVSCRVMDFLVYAFYNNSLCDELFAALRAMHVPIFDYLLYLYEHDELYTPEMKQIIASFRDQVVACLYESREAAEAAVLDPRRWPLYLTEELGTNESTSHWARLYAELDSVLTVLVGALTHFLAERGQLNDSAAAYFSDVGRLIVCRKAGIHNVERRTEQSFRFDFRALDDVGYAVDPRDSTPGTHGLRFSFYHDEDQRDEIRKAINVYGSHPRNIARMVKRSNLKKLSRRFERVTS